MAVEFLSPSVLKELMGKRRWGDIVLMVNL
jgi:hypothetical protein